jgi:WD40 repeat protein
MAFFTATMANGCAMLAMATSPNGKFVAVCEQCTSTANSGAQCSIYMIKNRKKLKNVVTPPQKEDFINCCFSGDSKILVTVSNGPNRNMIVWDWASPTKPMKHQIALGQTNVTRVSSPLTNPPGVLQLVTSGPYHLRVWNIQGDNPTKSQIIYKEHENFVDHCWLTLDGGVQRMAAVTEGGTAPNSNQRFGSILLCQSIDEDKVRMDKNYERQDSVH